MINEIKEDAQQRMIKALESLRIEFSKIRTGRAHTSLLDHVTVDYYGSEVPLSQTANLAVEDSRTLTVTPWERPMMAVIEKAILTSDLGLNPSSAGNVIRIPLPALTEERRKDLIKVVRAEAEQGKVMLRAVRRDAMQDLKELLKEKEISEDDERAGEEAIQKFTDQHVALVDKALEEKEQELIEV